MDVSDDDSLSDIVAANMSENPEDDDANDAVDTSIYDVNEGTLSLTVIFLKPIWNLFANWLFV